MSDYSPGYCVHDVYGGYGCSSCATDSARLNGWNEGYRKGIEDAAKAAAPYHHVGTELRGCPRFCMSCERSRQIQDTILALLATKRGGG